VKIIENNKIVPKATRPILRILFLGHIFLTVDAAIGSQLVCLEGHEKMYEGLKGIIIMKGHLIHER
jgi:hypothetical protein